MQGYINKIETLGLHDGPGIRVVVFMQGCFLRCLYCHNPEMFDNAIKNPYTPEELVNYILKYKSYFRNSGGVTFSGGEPLRQSEFLLEVCKILKEHDINIALDTSGIGLKNNKLLQYIDLILMDIKALNKENYLKITGLNYFNESINFILMCYKLKKRLWFRQVIVPGINDNIQYIEDLKIFANKYSPERIELLPYHTMAKNKYNKLGIKNHLEDIDALDMLTLDKLNEKLQEK